jgi:hypothetical protein
MIVTTLAQVTVELISHVIKRAGDVPADLLLAACTCCQRSGALVDSTRLAVSGVGT